MPSKTTCGYVELEGQTLRWRVFEEAPPNVFSRLANVARGKWVNHSRKLNATARAEVSTSGQFSTTRRSTVARTAAGAVLAGPVGAIVGHASKKREVEDTRRVYIFVESEKWSELFAFGGDQEHAARRLAQAINDAARRAGSSKPR